MSPADSEPPVNAPGSRIAGKYRVVRLLARGGMGTVLLVEHELLRQPAAIKLLQPRAPSPDATERFLREARAAAMLRSDHVVRVFDVGTLEDGTPYLLMEYLEGHDLAAELSQQGRVPLADAVDYLLQAIEAVAEAHDVGVIHRDLKPGNLFLTRKPSGARSLKVLDFGISKVVPGVGRIPAAAMTTDETLLGSPAYMSPEQIKTPRDVDARTDVWSLGVVLHEMITGRPAFAGETVWAMLSRILTDDVPPPSTLAAELPAALDEVLKRCLARDRAARYPSVLALREALLPFAGAPGPIAAPPSSSAAEPTPEAVVLAGRETLDEAEPPRPPERAVETADLVRGSDSAPALTPWLELESPLGTRYQDEVCGIHTWRSVVIIVWRRPVSPETLTWPAAALTRAVKSFSHPVVMAAIIPANVKAPEGEARRALQEGIRSIDAHLTGAVNIVLGTGFQAAAIRAVLSGLSLAARQRHPITFVSSADEAADFIFDHWPSQPGRPLFRADIAEALLRLVPR